MLDKPIILCDMDDTTCETSKLWDKMLYDRHGIMPQDSTVYNKSEQYPNLSEEQVLAPIREEGFFANLEPKPHAVETILTWLRDGFDVRFASVVFPDCPHAYKDKMTWIQKHIPEMAKRTIIFSSHDKTLLYGSILIDDHPRHIEDAQWAMPICMAAPWNKHLVGKRLMANDWRELDNMVRVLLTWRGM